LHFGPNFYTLDGDKINCVNLPDVEKSKVLFVSVKRGFTIRFLKFFADLAFRGFVSAAAVEWAYQRSFPDDSLVHGSRSHITALVYYHVLVEAHGTKISTDKYVIDKDVPQSLLKSIDNHMHDNVFPDADATHIRELVGDGHAKVLTRCDRETKRVGKPRVSKPTRKRNYTNGWFLVCAPSGRIVTCVSMEDPENNDVVTSAFTRALKNHPSVNCVVYDRACSWADSVCKTPEFKNVKYYAVDKFHGERHGKKCKRSPKNIVALRRRLKNVNTSVCEQIFSWFRNYARGLNDMMANRNRLLVLVYAKMHNEVIKKGETRHLGDASKKTPKRTPYVCNDKSDEPKRKAMKVMKTMKRTMSKRSAK
jgi:hypothetical protein